MLVIFALAVFLFVCRTAGRKYLQKKKIEKRKQAAFVLVDIQSSLCGRVGVL